MNRQTERRKLFEFAYSEMPLWETWTTEDGNLSKLSARPAMNKLEEQTKFVQDALRAGKKVAIAAPRERVFEHLVGDMIPSDLEVASRQVNSHVVRFKNGAVLAFIPATQGNRSLRGTRVDLALYYPSFYGEFYLERARMDECYEMLRERGVEMRELEMP